MGAGLFVPSIPRGSRWSAMMDLGPNSHLWYCFGGIYFQNGTRSGPSGTGTRNDCCNNILCHSWSPEGSRIHDSRALMPDTKTPVGSDN